MNDTYSHIHCIYSLMSPNSNSPSTIRRTKSLCVNFKSVMHFVEHFCGSCIPGTIEMEANLEWFILLFLPHSVRHTYMFLMRRVGTLSLNSLNVCMSRFWRSQTLPFAPLFHVLPSPQERVQYGSNQSHRSPVSDLSRHIRCSVT